MIRELKYNEITVKTKAEELTAAKNESIISRVTAEEAIKFGLRMKAKGYNIYVAGAKGCAKTDFAIKYAREQAAKEPVPEDLCYVYNFKSPFNPKLLKLKAGTAAEFKEDMSELIHRLCVDIPKINNLPNVSMEKDAISNAAQRERDAVLNDMIEEAKKHNFDVKQGQVGFMFAPMSELDDDSENDDEIKNSGDKEQREAPTLEETAAIQELGNATMRLISDINKREQDKLEDADYNLALLSVGRSMAEIQAKYADNEQISRYLVDVKEDILENIEDFSNYGSKQDVPMPFLGFGGRRDDEEWLSKYGVNVIVDNSRLEGAPVIINYNPTYTNLVGEVEYESDNGNLTTDFMKIKPGLFHKANGGYLIFNAMDLLGNNFAWDTTEHMLKTETVTIEPLKEYQLGGLTVAGIKPEPLKANIKVIIVGSMYYYDMLKTYDDNFSKLYKVCAVADYEMDRNPANMAALIESITGGAMPVTMGGKAALLDFASRMAQRQDKVSACFDNLRDIIREAELFARDGGESEISEKYINEAITKKEARLSLYAEKYMDMIRNNEIYIDTEGFKVGQINGLCVVESDEHTFGMPTRITATTYTGKAGVVNIEKEAEMSGSIHDKGVNILTGYLGMKYAQQFPLTLSCRICFEQSYSGVDGDSASSTETYAIISSLSGVPINQSIAVTGSVNQLGEIQPIGGATYKIEGFYKICRHRGLTGKQGVMIPSSNIKDLVLSDEVSQAVKDGLFHIYAIDTIDDGLEVLTGKKAGNMLASGGYSRGSVHALAYNKLKKYYKLSKEE